jgi:hypothetical protein
LSFPTNAAQNVATDLTLKWDWVDELLVNGDFEQGFNSGWSVYADSPAGWEPMWNPDLTTFAGTSERYTSGYATLSQDVSIPGDATRARLSWKERMGFTAQMPVNYRTRLIISAVQGGAYLQVFEDMDGHQPEYSTPQWIQRSADLTSLAGQSFQLSIQCRRVSPLYALQCWADVDGFSLQCSHSATPEFQVFLCKSGESLSGSCVGSTTALAFTPPELEPLTTYQWQVASVRDGVTKLSAIRSFRTGQSSAPRVLPVTVTSSGVTLQFPSRTDRRYALEQIETLDGSGVWTEVVPPTQGTGTTMELEAPLPVGVEAYWRLRISP